jgi:hypothetical protein
VAIGAVALLAVGGLAVVVLRDGGSGSSGTGDGDEPQIREELLDGVESSPDCPDAAEAPTPAAGEVVVTVVRVADGCLAYSGEAVAEDRVDARLRELRADPEVVAADRVVARAPGGSAAPTGDEPVEQWALAPEHLDGAKVRELWPAGAPEVRVAVIDTGIDETHLDLADQIEVRAPWVHRYDGDGYTDHGTHVAGIVAAADDGAGALGLTPAARLMDVQYWDEHGSDDLAGPSNDLGEYVRWAVDHGADVVNMSIQGSAPSDTEATAVLYAERQGVIVVGISGNCGDEDESEVCDERNEAKWPAGFDTVLGVANHDEDGERYKTSSANATVDIAAPGTDIVSDCRTDADGGGDRRPTCENGGTSMAAPYVAATAALLRARHPDATPAAIREAITRSAHPAEGQPEGERNDELGWGLLDPAAAAAYLDEHPGGTEPAGSGSHERTRVAYVEAETHKLMVLDDGIPHPVLEIPDDDFVSTVDWSGDRSQLVGATDTGLVSWTGPGSEVREVPCDRCEVAFLDRLGGDLIAVVGADGTITRYDPATLEPLGSAPMALPAPDLPIVLRDDTGRALLVGHATDASASGPNELWLVDPISGEPIDSHLAAGNVRVSDVAVDATGDRVAYLGGQSMETCDGSQRTYLLDASGGELDEVATAPAPTSDLGVLEADDIFFNGDTLYTTFIAHEPGDNTCTDVASAGVWRFDADSASWEQVADAPVTTVRPVEGLTGDPETGKVTIDFDSREGRFVPTGSDGSEQAALGETQGYLWATPTSTEVDLAREGSPPPVDGGSEGSDTTDTTEPGGGGGDSGSAPNTTEAAVARYEDYLHAVGEEDIDTMCEIAGPASASAEQQGFGDCPTTFGIMLGMISADQKAALRTATIDVDQVSALGGRVDIPATAVVADVAFTESDLGDNTLAYQDGNWFIVDQP